MAEKPTGRPGKRKNSSCAELGYLAEWKDGNIHWCLRERPPSPPPEASGSKFTSVKLVKQWSLQSFLSKNMSSPCSVWTAFKRFQAGKSHNLIWWDGRGSPNWVEQPDTLLRPYDLSELGRDKKRRKRMSGSTAMLHSLLNLHPGLKQFKSKVGFFFLPNLL